MNNDLSLSQSFGGLRVANPDSDNEEAVASPTSPVDTPMSMGSSARPPPPSSHASSTSDGTITEARMIAPTLSHDSLGVEEAAGGSLGFDPETYTPRSLETTRTGSGYSPTLSQQGSRSPSGQGVRRDEQRIQQHRLSHRTSMPLGHQAQQAMSLGYSASNYPAQQMRVPSVQGSAVRPVSGMYMQPNSSSSSNMSSYTQNSYRYRDEMGSSDGSVTGLARSGSRGAKGVLAGVVGRADSRSYRSASGGQMNGGNGPAPPRRNSRRNRAPTAGSQPGYPDSDAMGYERNSEQARTAEDWRERGAATVQRRETDSSTGQQTTRLIKKGVKDFNFGRTLGEGSYSTVLAATDRQNLKEYAIKVLDKRHIIKEKKVKYVNIERDTLNRLGEHPGIVRLYYTFQDEQSLYFVLDLATQGELLGVVKKLGSFDVECTKFYGAQILDAVGYMHERGIIHRDLKPENVLLDREMHVKITDFGTAKILQDPTKASNGTGPGDPLDGAGVEAERASSFVGTAEYVSPELLNQKNACKASDLWAFGCMIYQLLAGRPPFKAANEYLTFQKILALNYTFPTGFPEVAQDLVERLLVLDPAKRLPVEHIKNHRFFEGVQWGKGLWQQKAPRLKPYVAPPVERVPIKLNGAGKATAAAGAAAAMAQQTGTSPSAGTTQAPAPRPQLRGVTELPPPSQLDIDWSPVLGNNERILKLGNLVVNSCPPASSEPGTPSEKPKFRSFFGGGGGQKKRERLVLITSSARVIIAAAGGNEKKAKSEASLVSGGAAWKSFTDAKGLVGWQLDTKDKHLTFEDPRATTSDPAGSKFSTQEWLDALSQAQEIALSQSTINSSYSSQSMNFDSPNGSTPDGDEPGALPGANVERHNLRQTLRKMPTDDGRDGGGDGKGGAGTGRKRFSKRHSKSGLAAVF